jgi:glycosyltransferase involved in cell wall biosynthesis
MKVLHIIGSINPVIGGPAKSSQGLCHALNKLGCESVLLSFTPDEEQFSTLSAGQLISVKRKIIFSQKNELEDTIKKVHPDIIHCNGLWSVYAHLTANAAAKFQIPLVVSPRGTLSDWSLNHKRYKKRIAWIFYQRKDLLSASAFHATSEEESGYIKKLKFNQQVYIVPNGLELQDFLPSQKSTVDKRQVLFLSRIHFQKGLKELLEAWAKIKPDKWVLQISGTDSDNQQSYFLDLAKKLDILNSVYFTGPLNETDKWSALRQSDLLVLPSYSENFGLVVAEAMAAEVPVITTKATPWKELIGNKTKRAGWWIDLGVDPLVVALKEAINLTDDERHQMGKRGREIVKGKYSWSAVADKMFGAYREILKMNNLYTF